MVSRVVALSGVLGYVLGLGSQALRDDSPLASIAYSEWLLTRVILNGVILNDYSEWFF